MSMNVFCDVFVCVCVCVCATCVCGAGARYGIWPWVNAWAHYKVAINPSRALNFTRPSSFVPSAAAPVLSKCGTCPLPIRFTSYVPVLFLYFFSKKNYIAYPFFCTRPWFYTCSLSWLENALSFADSFHVVRLYAILVFYIAYHFLHETLVLYL